MKITNKKSLKFACKEYSLRYGDEYNATEIEDQVKQEEYCKYWEDNPESMLATMIYDGIFCNCSRKRLATYIKFFGKKLWDEACICVALRDHDT